MQKSIDDWIFQRRYRLLIFVCVILFGFAANYIPYISLLFSKPYLSILILVCLAPFILKVEAKILFTLAIGGFLLVFLFWFLGQTEEAEVLIEYIFILLLAGTIRSFVASG